MQRHLRAVAARLAPLDNELRLRLFEFVRTADRPTSRDEVAAELGISRNLAAFHLDKLVRSGLLRTADERPVEGSRGRGRRPKLYEPAELDVDVSLPERRYALAGEILVDVLARAVEGEEPEQALEEVARVRGRDLGCELGAGEPPEDLLGALDRLGFEPHRTESQEVELHNCPFHALARHSPELVCRMNLQLLTGLLEELEPAGVRAVLAPSPAMCCVRLQTEETT